MLNKKLALNELCWTGAAEAFKFGCPDAPCLDSADYKSVIKARELFETFTDEQMAVALLILMLDLGRRLQGREKTHA
jgi:hypothetical protein